MQDIVNTLMLICASIAALGLGLVLAYWTCKAVFATLRMQARPTVLEAPKPSVVRIQ